MSDLRSRMMSILGEMQAPDGEAAAENSDAVEVAGFDIGNLITKVAMSFESMNPDAEVKDMMAALKAISVGKQKTAMMSALRRFTASKAKSAARDTRKALS